MSVLTRADAVLAARKTLEIDETEDELPARYLSAFLEHVTVRPNDTNFIIEFAEQRKGAGVGGNGFGITTCLEDYCWSDVRLGADPTLPDGGKSTGFGSLWEYQNHCDLPDHRKGREERCRKANKTYLPYDPATAAAAPAPAPAAGSSTAAGAPANRSPSAPSASDRTLSAPSRTPSQTSLGASPNASASGSMSMLERLDAMSRPSSAASTSRPSAVGEIPAHRRLARTSSAASAFASGNRYGLARVSSSTSAIPSSSNMGNGGSFSSALRSTSMTDLSTANATSSQRTIPSRSSNWLDKKPSLSALNTLKAKPSQHSAGRTPPGSAYGTPSSSSRNARPGPAWIEVLSSDEGDDDVVNLDSAPKHMRKVTNVDAPILVSSDSSDEEVLPGSRPSPRLGSSQGARAGAGSGTQGKNGKRKQPLFRSGSGMGEGSVNIFEDMMASSQPKVKKEKQTDEPTTAASGSAAPGGSAAARSSTTDVKPSLNAASQEAVKDCRLLLQVEKSGLTRLKQLKGKSYLATAITRRTTELESFERDPMSYGAYPLIPSALVQHDQAFKAISKWHEYKRQIILFRGRGVSITAEQLAQSSKAPSRDSSPTPGSSSARMAPLTLGEALRLRLSVRQREVVILETMKLSPYIERSPSVYRAVIRRLVDLESSGIGRPYPPAPPAIVSADRSGKYAVLVASSDYQRLVAYKPVSATPSHVLGNGAVAGPSGSTSSSTSASIRDIKPNLNAPVVDQATIDREMRCARDHVIQQERQTIAWLLAAGPNPTLRGLILARQVQIAAAANHPRKQYPAISQGLLLADQTGQFTMIASTISYRLITAWSSGEDAAALVDQITGDAAEGNMPGAFPRNANGNGSSSNAAPFSLMGDITSAVNNLAANMAGGVFDPYAGVLGGVAGVPGAARMPPAVMHEWDCAQDDDCLCGVQADDDELYHRAGALMRHEDMQTFLQDSFKDFSDDSTIDEALEKLGMPDMNAKFADMTVQLMPHQILGVNFMLQKEKDLTKKGGLLCDAMGLGKTVQTIATIAGHQSEDKKCKTTLIIAPLAVLSQWKSEIESKTAPGLFQVIIYHGTNKPKSKNVLKNADVVLTTYQTMANESGIDQRRKKGYGRRSEDDDSDTGKTKQGILFGVRWYRIVLDEAHFIRNRGTKASKAVEMLDSVYRWCLTGTLVNNSLTDIFPHLRFLHISPQREWTSFNKMIGLVEKKRPKLAAKRVQAILRACMMRRHKDSMLNGQRLLNLPPKTTEVVELDFTPEERDIYNAIEQRMKVRFGQFLRQGTVLKHLSCVLVMLMRLRQLTCHPWLLRRNPGDPAHPNDFLITDDDIFHSLNMEAVDTAGDLDRATRLLGQAWIDETTLRLTERYTKVAEDKDSEEGLGECPICFEPFVDEVITQCRHSYCKTCINELFTAPPRDATELTEQQVQQGVRNCPLCRGAIDHERAFAALAFFDPEKDAPRQEEGDVDVNMDVKPDIDRKGKRKASANDDDGDDYKPDIKPGVKKGKGRAKPEPKDEEEDVHRDPVEAVLPSTKMLKLKELLDIYLAEDGIKVIVFSEFVEYLNLVAVYLDAQGVNHGSYTGRMRQGDREDIVRQFNETKPNSPRVLLISRKAGGAGLNLTVASKVISLDLAWNAAAENQAVDRAHRIGQTRPVEVQRLVIANTVEQRILDLQAKKEALSDGAMGEGNGSRVGRLTVNDLMRLFNYEEGHEDA